MKYLQVLVVQRNTVPLFAGTAGGVPVVRAVDCEALKVGRPEWAVPVMNNGLLDGYEFRTFRDPADAPADAIRVLKLSDVRKNETIWIALPTNKTDKDFVDMCNACCDSAGGNDFSVAASSLPEPINETTTCAVSPAGTAVYTHNATAVANPFARNIILNDLTYNDGTPPAVAVPGAGFANMAALVTWANTNNGAMGTWSAPTTTTLRLVSPTTKSVNLELGLVAATFCLTLPSTPFTATTLVLTDGANQPYSVPISPLIVSQANKTAVRAALEGYMTGATLTIATNNIQYLGQGKPVRLTDGTNNANFTAGACA